MDRHVRTAAAAAFFLSAVTSAGAQAPAAPTPPPAAPSRCDAACIRANLDRAAQACARPIEAQAPIDYEWISRPFAAIFDEADPPGPDQSVVSYRGDSIRYLSAQKEWIRVSYDCGYDVAAQKIVRLNVRPGRLGRPAQPSAASAAKAPASNGAPGQIKADLLAAAIAKAAAQNANGAAKAAQRPSRTVRFGEPSAVEILQVQ